MIPKILHFVWVGDESKRPDKCIGTWREKNPSYNIKIWGNETLEKTPWVNGKHIRAMLTRKLCGVADMMRYEILYREGGITLDADSICLSPLEDWLLKPDAFAHWEQEITRPGLINVSVMGSVAQNPFFGECALRLKKRETVLDKPAWRSTGPVHLTEVFRDTAYNLTIYPSHYFTKDHFTGISYEGAGHCFATQYWGSTRGYEGIE